MELVFATHNKNKLKEIQLLVPKPITLLSLTDLGLTTQIPETAKTLEGNARLKADFVTKTYNMPCFADDTGLLVNALNGKPGVFSARYAGANNDAQANMNKLLEEMRNKKDRSASFKTVIALNMNDQSHLFHGEVKGLITTEQRGHNGFGYDPIFMPEGYDQTFSELPLKIKNEISHRAKAFKKLLDYLQQLAL